MRQALVDTNILLLVMCASLSRDPSQDKRLSRYCTTDTTIIQNLILRFDQLLTTPQILTEMSNLSRSELERRWLIEYVGKVKEKFIDAMSLVKSDLFVGLGLADTGFFEEEFKDSTIVTDDEDLACQLFARSRPVIFYREYRSLAVV